MERAPGAAQQPARSSDPLPLARQALEPREAWVVGGAVRDRLLGRAPARPDLDLIVASDAEDCARRCRARAPRGSAAFALSDAFGGWRVVGPGGAWQIDITPLHADGLEADLRARDLTLNALAEPLAGGELVDPTGGRRDLEDGVLRMAGPRSFVSDPLRVVRLVRFAVELGMTPEAQTVSAARESASGLDAVAGERIFAELRAMICAPDPAAALRGLDDLGATQVILPELAALQGVEQTVYHHRDVYGHTLEVLDRVVALASDPAQTVGDERAGAVGALLAEPLADELTRGGALRWGALLHDIAKPQTRAVYEDGAVGFPGHDRAGAEVARDVLARIRASVRLREHVAGLARHHLRAGFLVKERPLSRRVIHAYLVACGPVAADVTLLSIADRLATRGRKAEISIDRHMEVALPLLDAALEWHATGPAPQLVRGDYLAAALGIEPGPQLGELLSELAAAHYAGEIASADEAIEHARRVLAGGPPS